jgi:hypothetical protein
MLVGGDAQVNRTVVLLYNTGNVVGDFNRVKELYCGWGSFGADDGLSTLSTCTISVPADSLFA